MSSPFTAAERKELYSPFMEFVASKIVTLRADLANYTNEAERDGFMDEHEAAAANCAKSDLDQAIEKLAPLI